jgi:hypothetical protein
MLQVRALPTLRRWRSRGRGHVTGGAERGGAAGSDGVGGWRTGVGWGHEVRVVGTKRVWGGYVRSV